MALNAGLSGRALRQSLVVRHSVPETMIASIQSQLVGMLAHLPVHL